MGFRWNMRSLSRTFRDNIESQVADESQGLTRLLAQCVGKGKDAIRIRKSPCRM